MEVEEKHDVKHEAPDQTLETDPALREGENGEATPMPRPRRRVRRMSLLSITAKPQSPSEDHGSFEEYGMGIGRRTGMLESLLEQNSEVPKAFKELQSKVQRRRRRSVDTVTDDVLAFERTVNLRINDLTTAIRNRANAEEEKHRTEKDEVKTEKGETNRESVPQDSTKSHDEPQVQHEDGRI